MATTIPGNAGVAGVAAGPVLRAVNPDDK